jgi:hypothetical protein
MQVSTHVRAAEDARTAFQSARSSARSALVATFSREKAAAGRHLRFLAYLLFQKSAIHSGNSVESSLPASRIARIRSMCTCDSLIRAGADAL